MTPPGSPLREFLPAVFVRPRARGILVALVILALVAVAPLMYGGTAAAQKPPAAKAKVKPRAAAAARGSRRAGRRSPTRAGARRAARRRSGRARDGRRRMASRSAERKPVQAEAAPSDKTQQVAKTKHKPGATKGGGKSTAPDEATHQPGREGAQGNATPSPAGAGGGSSRPQRPRPAHASSGSAAPSPAALPATQRTTAAGTVPTRPLPVGGSRRQPGSRRGERRTAAPRDARVADTAAAALRAPRLAPVASVPEQAPAPRGTDERRRPKQGSEGDDGSPVEPVTRTVRDIVEVVPAPIQRLLLALGALSLLLGAGYLAVAARARRLERQRGDLLQEVGLLQAALLPPVPPRLGAVETSVAYRPSDGPAAGGDFYDALMLSGGRAGFILGDVSGHGRPALARTAFIRYTLRAYLEAGLEPRMALQVTGRVVDEHLGGDFATVLVAVHDPRTGSLTYASAGHPAPIVLGSTRPEPVLAASAPPIGLGMRTGLRQTTLPLPPRSLVCLYTDGLTEARTNGGILGRPRLGDIVEELGPEVTASQVLERVAAEARLVSDDMAAVVLSPTAGVTAGGFRTEQLEVDAAELDDGLADRFLEACGADFLRIDAAVRELRQLCEQYGGAVLHVRFGIRGPRIEVVPRNVESLEAASRRALALAR